jgi:hypothetical protein
MGVELDGLQVLDDAVAWARSHAAQLFPGGRVDAMSLLSYVMADVLGRGECRIAERDGWWVVSSDVDWLAHASVSVERLFTRVVAAPEHGDHSLRAEVVINAFASDVAVWNGDVVVIKGEPPASAIWPHGRRALAFRLAHVA